MLRRASLAVVGRVFLVVGVPGFAVLQGCGDDEPGSQFKPSDEDGGTDATITPPPDDDGGPIFRSDSSTDSAPRCVTGASCDNNGGVCAGGVCCAPNLACGEVCCAASQVCSFQRCVVPGAVCRDSSDCAAGHYCEFSLGTKSGVADAGAPDGSASDGSTNDSGASEAGTSEGGSGDGGAVMCSSGVDQTGKCLPRPPECAPGTTPPTNGKISCLEKCEYKPVTPTFSPVLKVAWGGVVASPYNTDVMMAPIVVQLTDDDCDGKITERDIPEIVFSTFSSTNYDAVGVLHAISIHNGAFVEKWAVPGIVNATKHVAGGNFDGLPGNEIVACGNDGKVKAFRGTDGALLWTTVNTVACHMPSIADIDGDGNVEIIVEGAILNGADGTLKQAYAEPIVGNFVVSDIDGDGQLDIVTATKAFHANGTKFVDTGLTMPANFENDPDSKGPFVGIGDFDVDGKPEVVAVDNHNHSIAIWRYDAVAAQKFTIVRAAFDMNQKFGSNPCTGWGATHGGGPPTVADFDKDGYPDVGLAGGIGYVVLNGKKLVDPNETAANSFLWWQSTTDCSSASTGSTVFDFDGDGKAEVVYSDEVRMRIYDGATGNVLTTFCNTTATLSEFPLVADVDNDGHADIIVASNAYGKTCTDGSGATTRQAGIRVFGDVNGSWVRTRRVWNEHAYHITNVNEDGTIPRNELPNWTQTGLNNFRQNKQPGSEFAAPNVVASVAPVCPGPTSIRVTVRNLGQALVPAGVVVGVYSGTPGSGVKLGAVTTTRVLYPAEAEPLDFAIPAGPLPSNVYTVVDDGAPAHPSWHECRTDDNTSAAVSLACTTPR